MARNRVSIFTFISGIATTVCSQKLVVIMQRYPVGSASLTACFRSRCETIYGCSMHDSVDVFFTYVAAAKRVIMMLCSSLCCCPQRADERCQVCGCRWKGKSLQPSSGGSSGGLEIEASPVSTYTTGKQRDTEPSLK